MLLFITSVKIIIIVKQLEGIISPKGIFIIIVQVLSINKRVCYFIILVVQFVVY